jgi:hypothetical protein
MGLVLYPLLILFGIRGMSFKHAALFCLLTAVILTILSIGAIEDMPGCSGLSCQLPAISGTLFMTLAIAFGCFGFGAVVRRLSAKPKR